MTATLPGPATAPASRPVAGSPGGSAGGPASVPAGGDDPRAIVLDALGRARAASTTLGRSTGAVRAAALHAVADALVAATEAIVAANAADLERGRADGLAQGLLDRLTLDAPRVAAIAAAVRAVAALPDPLGRVRRGQTLPNGLRLTQVQVPLGVLGVVYEARPNVTVDAAALAIASGNAAVLRGGSAAAATNAALIRAVGSALAGAGLDAGAVVGIDAAGREGVGVLLTARGLVDLVIPRGGASLIQRVVAEATVPTVETGVGLCHVYVDAAADLDDALAICLDAKVSRPSVCNAAETLLVHADVAPAFVPRLLRALDEAGVLVRGDETVVALAPDGVAVVPVTEADFDVEHLALEVCLAVVPDLDAALAHVAAHGSGHTEAIVTADVRAAEAFVAGTDSAAVMVNASTRFTDGSELGLGAEVGISTQKLHARGPMGLDELTTTRWVVRGDGHVRG